MPNVMKMLSYVGDSVTCIWVLMAGLAIASSCITPSVLAVDP